MKGSIKTLVVFVVIVTIATFISAAMGSAAGHKKKAIHGEYAATSAVSCNTYLPDGTVNAGTATQLSIYTFNGDGTGTVQGRFVMIGLSPNPSEGFLDMAWDFTYEVADDGTITMDAVPGTGFWTNDGVLMYTYTGGTFSDSGRFSQDHKTIILGTIEPNDTVLTLPIGFSFHTKCKYLARLDPRGRMSCPSRLHSLSTETTLKGRAEMTCPFCLFQS